MSRFCQSCGMPMKQDPQGGGSNADGSRSSDYCSYCYADGNLISPEIDTPRKMQEFCIGKMKESGMPGFVAWLLTRSIPRLKRWTAK